MDKVCILITGDRDAKQRDWAETLLMDFSNYAEGADRKVLIHGAALGIDTIGARVWRDMFGGDETIRPFIAEWEVDGKAAGPRRNEKMLAEIIRRRKQGWEVHVFGYHPDLWGKSKGTRHMLEIASAAGFPPLFRDRPRQTARYIQPWRTS